MKMSRWSGKNVGFKFREKQNHLAILTDIVFQVAELRSEYQDVFPTIDILMVDNC